jgi:hypothetical protein
VGVEQEEAVRHESHALTLTGWDFDASIDPEASPEVGGLA